MASRGRSGSVGPQERTGSAGPKRGRQGSTGPDGNDSGPSSGGLPAPRGRQGSAGPPADRSRGRQGSVGPAERKRESSAGPAGLSARQLRRVRLKMESLLGEDLRTNYDLLSAVHKSEKGEGKQALLWWKVEKVAELLKEDAEAIAAAANVAGSETSDFFVLEDDLLRRKSLSKQDLDAIRATLKGGKPPAPASSSSRGEWIAAKVDYYFGPESLPYDYKTLQMMRASGDVAAFPFSYLVSAPALVRAECTEDEVKKVVESMPNFELVELMDPEGRGKYAALGVHPKRKFSDAQKGIAERTLERGLSRMRAGEEEFTVRCAKEEEERFQKKKKPSRKRAAR